MQRWQADLGLVGITLIWGSTFIVVKSSLEQVGPLLFVAARFWSATLALLLIYLLLRRPRRTSWQSPGLLRDGMLTGLFLTLGYITQTIGLESTEASKAGFITGLNVAMVPLFAAFLLRQPPTWYAVLGVALATVGLGLMSLNESLTIAPGELWVLACAVAFALHIVAISHYSSRHAIFPYALIQLLTAALGASLAALWLESAPLATLRPVLPSVLYIGVVATAFILAFQSWFQRYTTPTHTALIFTLEPVAAAFFAWLVAGERLTTREWQGALLILAGMLLVEGIDSWLNQRAKKRAAGQIASPG